MAALIEQVLQRDGNAVQHPAIDALPAFGIGGIGIAPCSVRVDFDEGVRHRLPRVDALEALLDEVAGTQRAVAQAPGGIEDRHESGLGQALGGDVVQGGVRAAQVRDDDRPADHEADVQGLTKLLV